MRVLPQDEHFLQRALDLAAAAVGLASPNPTVGCVLVRDGVALGEGAHRYDELDHAEIVALKQAAREGARVAGATAYVTLEPCSHQGRTGPCADALIAAGVARCVVATIDPNPLVRGQGAAKLHAAGVDVVVWDAAGPLAKEARRLNDAFAFSVLHGRPFVTLKAAVSVDGMIAPPQAARTGRAPVWLTGGVARADVQRLRHEADAIVVGVGTVLADNPALTDRTGRARRRALLRVVLDCSLRTPLDAALVASACDDVLVVAGCEATARESQLRESGVEVVRVGSADGGGLDLNEVLAMLHGKQIRSVLVEGGAAVHAAFLRTGLVDRVVLYISETELGSGAVPFAAGQISPYALQEQLSSVERVAFAHDAGSPGDDVRVCGYLHDPWAGVAG